ncbi:hypothetical protein SKP52_05690 [Sphingopyxis fribergensis]|uniref:Uncharacterized protein n=1 Tax=Sphingopyxis fribergensis TaxID=1515612 RepID=A0A0A7PFQ0_9SPHN|nr:hypothetical protein SKP52_05690 [Sphingopyxis fribergensis]
MIATSDAARGFGHGNQPCLLDILATRGADAVAARVDPRDRETDTCHLGNRNFFERVSGFIIFAFDGLFGEIGSDRLAPADFKALDLVG